MSAAQPEPAAGVTVFLSYSRKDRDRVDPLVAALRNAGVRVLMDTDDILPTEEWRARLMQLMQEADTIVVALSPNSVTSEVCSWEIEYSAALHKRMAPFVLEEVDLRLVPPLLARLNFIFATPDIALEAAVAQLLVALRSNIGWVREHTRLQTAAQRWHDRGRPGHLLLRGKDVAEAEAWRDSPPDGAPEISALQAQFIGQARRHMVRNQRRWTAGSAIVAIATAALAAFAWVKSLEADQQRQLAEANAGRAEEARQAAETNAELARAAQQEAEANAALAEAARVEAEEQRSLAAQRLVAQNLRAGDFGEAAANLLGFQPDAPQLPTLLALMESPAQALSRVAEGGLVRVDGALFLNRGAGGLLPVDSGFPASYWLPLPDGSALISGAGAVESLDSSGQPVATSPDLAPFEPCFAYADAEAITLAGGVAFGYSACSLALRTVRIPLDGGAMSVDTLRACSDTFLPIEGPDAAPVMVDDLIGQCLTPETLARIRDGSQRLGDAQVPLSPIGAVTFPSMRPIADLWEGPTDPVAITTAQADRRRGYAVPGSPRYEVLFDFEGREAPGYALMDDLSTPDLIAIRTLAEGGGTGGEAHDLCVATPPGDGRCFRFLTAGGYEGVARDSLGTRVALFGEALSGWEFGAGEAGLWLVDAPGDTPRALPGFDRFGRILDLDFGPGGAMAVLTPAGLLLVEDPDAEPRRLTTPTEARAVRWLSDGRILLLAEQHLYIGSDSEGASFTALQPLAPASETESRERPWLAVDAEETTALVGFGRQVTPFDLQLLAPIMPQATIDHPRLDSRPSAVRLSRREDGGLTVEIAGAVYRTPGYDGTDPELFFGSVAGSP